jgi:hypothetical protein
VNKITIISHGFFYRIPVPRCLNQAKVSKEIYHSGLFFNQLGIVPRLKQGYLEKNPSSRFFRDFQMKFMVFNNFLAQI